MRRKLIIGNWKMHGNRAANADLLDRIRAGASGRDIDCAVCVPFPYLSQCAAALGGAPVGWGAQDVSEHAAGAYTGEVSAAMLADLGCAYVIVGHSERRLAHCESDALVARKTRAALAADLTPIVCLGETLEQRASDATLAVVLRQLDAVLESTPADAIGRLVLAYEPLWAIGSGRIATPALAQEVCAALRHQVGKRARGPAQQVRILYGGSMKPGNAAAILGQADIDGGLVGGASLDAAEFIAIARAAELAAG
jgi:triosephosphate isomerase